MSLAAVAVARTAVSRDHAEVTPANRRKHARAAGRGLAGHVQTRDGSTPGVSIENISKGGVFVRTANALEIGTPVLLRVVRPGLKRAIEIVGRVVTAIDAEEARTRGCATGMGIAFDRLEGDAAERLGALVAELTPEAAEPRKSHVALVRAKSAAPRDESALEELAVARESAETQRKRVEALEDEVRALRRELLRRNRTIGDLANRLQALGAA